MCVPRDSPLPIALTRRFVSNFALSSPETDGLEEANPIVFNSSLDSIVVLLSRLTDRTLQDQVFSEGALHQDLLHLPAYK